jgi:uncharacterized damage-inducible protein DinB
MSLAHALVAELEHEAGLTRQLIAALPEAKAAWQPHAKSMTLGALAVHLVDCLAWGADTMRTTEFDMAPVGGPAWQPTPFVSVAASLAAQERNTAALKAALLAAAEGDFMVQWSFKKAGQVLFAMPRIGVLRGMILNHHIHHRGQLTVYLRLIDVALPATYGPSADAPM